jgi:hypothetical protein
METKKAKYTQLEIKNAYDGCFGGEHGKVVIEHLCDIAGITNFTSALTHEQLLLEKGRQHVVFSILSILNTDPKVIIDRVERNLTKEYTNE